jgi:hypothetical protein
VFCCFCRRLILSEDEICLLRRADGDAGEFKISEQQRGCAQALARLGYIERVGRGRYIITAYGHRRLAEIDIVASTPPLPGTGDACGAARAI